MEYSERMRPKGYDKRVWNQCYWEAEANKRWAKDTVINNPKWCAEASESGLEMLGSYLHLPAYKLATEAYDYLKMRSHGCTFLGALDPSARREWEFLSGKTISRKAMWKYDHTVHITSAKIKNGKWIDSSGTLIKTGE